MGTRRLHFLWASIALFGPAFPQAVFAQTVAVTPTAASVHLGTYYQFSDKVTGATPTTVTWTVALPTGATGSAGSISTGGFYTPPPAMPSVNTVSVKATSVAAPTVSASATITLENPFPTVASTLPLAIAAGTATPVTINGSGFVAGAQVLFGGAPLPTTYVSPTRLTVSITPATSQNNKRISIAVTNPAPGPSTSQDAVTIVVGTVDAKPIITSSAASRFLDQAAFGPDAATVAHVQGTGIKGYIAEQLTTPISPYPDPSETNIGINEVQARFFVNAVHGQDQLRQRVAFALSQIFVASAVEESTAPQLVPYLQILQNDAFANFRKIMNDVTLSPTMGEYLDMRNNDKANPALGTRANENYARELMQLFTIGLFELNEDGTLKTDSSNNPIPTYDQTTIQNFAKVYTGWTYPTKPGAKPEMHNPAYYVGPMVAYESNHDETAKTLLQYKAPTGVLTSLPAGQTAEVDLNEALDNIFYHPNVGPFISKQLIQHLVTSNPTNGYVGRVADVFNDNGHGVRGDMAAVVETILTDTEARAEDNGPSTSQTDNSGHLREPVFLLASILRGLGAQVNDSNNLAGLANNLGQDIFMPPTVFSYFAPGYQIPLGYTGGAMLGGPEFQLHSPLCRGRPL